MERYESSAAADTATSSRRRSDGARRHLPVWCWKHALKQQCFFTCPQSWHWILILEDDVLLEDIFGTLDFDRHEYRAAMRQPPETQGVDITGRVFAGDDHFRFSLASTQATAGQETGGEQYEDLRRLDDEMADEEDAARPWTRDDDDAEMADEEDVDGEGAHHRPPSQEFFGDERPLRGLSTRDRSTSLNSNRPPQTTESGHPVADLCRGFWSRVNDDGTAIVPGENSEVWAGTLGRDQTRLIRTVTGFRPVPCRTATVPVTVCLKKMTTAHKVVQCW